MKVFGCVPNTIKIRWSLVTLHDPKKSLRSFKNDQSDLALKEKHTGEGLKLG